MLNVSGDRIMAAELITWLLDNVDPEDRLVIVAAEGEAALLPMSRHGGHGSRALDVPVFTEPSDFYTRPAAPAVDYLGENVTGTEPERAPHGD